MEIELSFPSFRTAQGIWQHHIRQSDVNEYRKCPELFRQIRHGVAPKWENDSAVIGTACHEAYRASVEGLVDTMADAIEVGRNVLNELWPGCRRVQIKSEEHAHRSVVGCIEAFWNDVLDSILNEDVVATETPFDCLVNRTPNRELYLSGTSDVWTKASNKDYKHSRKDWKRDAWKIERYNVQSVLYSWARDQVEISQDQGRKFTLDYAWSDEFYPFEFININPDTFEVTRQTVQRKVADAKFLHDEIQAMCDSIEYLPKSRWPMRPDEWHCSPKWCPAWATCRGKYLGDDPWTLMARAEQLTGVSANGAPSGPSESPADLMDLEPPSIPSSAVIDGLRGMRRATPPADAT